MASLRPVLLTLCLFSLQLFLVCVNGNAALIEKTCKTTLYYDVCVAALNSDPSSAKADVPGLAAIALKKSLGKATDTKNYIAGLGQDPAISDCAENYDDAVDNLNQSVGALASRAFDDVNTWVSGAMTDADSCEDGFEGKPPNPLGQRNEDLNKLCSITLAIVKLI
ncbi:hypothetical protein AMTRI_Chr10g230880 [Amborella trichopoda]